MHGILTMAFKAPSKSMSRSKPLQSRSAMQSKKPLQTQKPLQAKPLSPADQLKAQKKALQAQTIRALEKTRRDAAASGLDLSEWEGEFIEGVSERVKTYGRAFADPDKGAMNGTLSLRQGLKLREIRKKIKTKAIEKDEENP